MLNEEDKIEQDLKTMILNSEDLQMEEIISNRFKEFSFDSYVRGSHMYEDIWNPHIGEDSLKCAHGKRNEYDKFA